MTKQDQLQQSFLPIIKRNPNITVWVSVRVGKTKLTLDSLEKDDKVLVVYPELSIKKSWINNVKKWGSPTDDITYTTWQSLKKYCKEEYDVVVIDEAHKINDKRAVAIHGIKAKRKIALTGTLTKDAYAILTGIGLKLCVKYTIEDAIKDGVIKDYNINIYMVPLNDGNQKVYAETESRLAYASDQASRGNSYYVYQKRIWENKRRDFLYNNRQLTDFAKNYLEHFRNEKILVFCLRTDAADELSEYRYHYRNKDKMSLEEFQVSKDGHYAACKSLTMGMDFFNLNRMLFHSYESKEQNLSQMIGRSLISDGATVSNIDILCLEGTQQEQWLLKATRPFDQSKIRILSNRNVYSKEQYYCMKYPKLELYWYMGNLVSKSEDGYSFLNDSKKYNLSEKVLTRCTLQVS